MRIALFGGTGFVGSYLVEELLRQGHQPVLLVRPGSETRVNRRESCVLVPGEITSIEAIRQTLTGCDAVIYNIGIIRQNRRRGITFEELHHRSAVRVIDAATEQGVKRFILMSANGVRPDGAAYQRTKFKAEQHLKNTTLAWTIFRPSIMFGDPRGQQEFCTQLRDQLVRPPIPVPLFYNGLLPAGAGGFSLSPVHVMDVAALFVKALSMPDTIGECYPVCGLQEFSWRELIDLIAQAVSRNKWKVPVPATAVKIIAALLDRFAWFPITRDQVTMLLEGNTCDSGEVFRLFGIDPTPLCLENMAYLR